MHMQYETKTHKIPGRVTSTQTHFLPFQTNNWCNAVQFVCWTLVPRLLPFQATLLTDTRKQVCSRQFGVSNLLTQGCFCRSVSLFVTCYTNVACNQHSTTCFPDFSSRECSSTICITTWLSISNFLIAWMANIESENITNFSIRHR